LTQEVTVLDNYDLTFATKHRENSLSNRNEVFFGGI
jgi:hypothetical protein